MKPLVLFPLAALVALVSTTPGPMVDESPFVKGLKPGEHEKILYVWTRDADHQESDFLAVVDVDPESETFGEIIATAPTGSAANEVHHFGYNVDADRIFGGAIASNTVYIYDVGTEPRSPRLIRQVQLDETGYSGPHSVFAIPGGVMLAMLGTVDGGGPGALVVLDDTGDFIEAFPVVHPDSTLGLMYDVGVKPGMKRMVTSAWAHPMDVMEGTHLENAGKQAVVWDWETKEILQVADLDPAPFAVRWMHAPDARGVFVNAALGNSVWYGEDEDGDGTMTFHKVLTLPEGSVPVDMRVSYDDRFLYLSQWAGGKVQQYDISNPMSPELLAEVSLPQPNMMKLSPDSHRLYVTNSILSGMDGDVEFGAWLIHVGEDGMQLDPHFHPDFEGMPNGAGAPHDMLLK